MADHLIKVTGLEAESPATSAAPAVCAEAQGRPFAQMLAPLRMTERVAQAEAEMLRMVVELTRAPPDAVTLETPLMEAGLDSVASAEFVSQLKHFTGVPISDAVAFEHPTPRALADHLIKVTGLEAASPATPSSHPATVTSQLRSSGEGAPVTTLLAFEPHDAMDDPSSHNAFIGRIDFRALSASPEAFYRVEVATTGLMRTRGPKQPTRQQVTSTILLIHAIIGHTRVFDGLCNRALAQHTIFSISHDPLLPMPPSGFIPFQSLAARYAEQVVHTVMTPLDLLGVSNGTGIAHQTAHALRSLGGTPGRIVLLDPSPGPRIEAPIPLLSYQLAAELVLSIYNVPYEKEEFHSLEDDSILGFVMHLLHRARGPSAHSAGRIMQELQSMRQLLTAERTFYFDNADKVVPYSGEHGEAAIVLILSSEEFDIEASYKDGVAPAGQEGRPLVRSFFGEVREELVVDGDHLAVSVKCAGGQIPAFNEAVEGP